MVATSPRAAYRLLLLGFIGVYAGKLVIGRLSVLGDEYTKAHTSYWKFVEQQHDCDERDKTHHTFDEACDKARDGVKRWPIAMAETWAAIIVASIVVLSIVYFLCSGIYGRVEKWQRYNSHYEAAYTMPTGYTPPHMQQQSYVAQNMAALQSPDDAAIYFDNEAFPVNRERTGSPVRRRQPTMVFASRWND
jgi:hypothetical protein